MQMLDEKRVFLALNLPADVKSEVNYLLQKLKKSIKYVKWWDENILHITLHFLGNLIISKIDELIEHLNQIEGRFNDEMTFKLGDLNAFPNIYKARVIFLETKQQSGTNVLKLHKEILDELMKLSLEVDLRKWAPHITIGRAESKIDSDIFKRYKLANNLIFSIKSFELMESKLTPAGPIYKVVKSFKF